MPLRAKAILLCLICLMPFGARTETRNPALPGRSADVGTRAYSLKVALDLKRSHDDVYDAKVSVTITDSCFYVGKLRLGLPWGTVGIPEVQYLTFPFTHEEGQVCGQMARTVSQTISVPFSDAKPKATAFAVVNGEVAGSDTQPFPHK
jgi:hypothetical protein